MNSKKMEAVNNYGSGSIQVLEGLEAVRKRPAMYIGNTNSSGLAHIVFEIFDNAVDEVLADFADTIRIQFYPDGSVSVEDNGRGIPPESLEVIFTTLHAGGKFNSDVYKSSGGLHGVGTSVTNAMSEWLEATVYRGGREHYIRFENGGKPVDRVKVVGTCDKDKMGTLVRFKPDASLFSTVKFNVERIEQRARESAFLNPKVKIEFNDLRTGNPEIDSEKVFDYSGMEDYLKYLAGNDLVSIEPRVFEYSDEATGMEAIIAFQWVENDENTNENILSYVNNIRTRDGGTHETGFKSGLTKAFNTFGKDAGLLKGKYNKVSGDDIRDGIVAVISTKIPENILEFESQTKDKLGTIEARSLLDSFSYDAFIKFLSTNKSDAEYLIDRAIKYQKMKEESKRQKDTTKKSSSKDKKLVTSDKLTEPISKDYSKRELFLVEGDSAGGCHTIDTRIKMADNTSKSIEELLFDFENGVENMVIGYDLENRKFKPYKVLDVFYTKTTHIIKLNFKDGTSARVTPEHPYLLETGEWKPAVELEPTDSLRTYSIDKNYVVSKEILEVTEKVYDITVDKVHNFALDNGIIVHNSAKEGRFKDFQGILSLRGKVLNTAELTLAEALANAEIQTLVATLKCGTGANYSEEDLQYDKVIIMTDADVDGSHITILLLTFFFKFMRKFVENGHLYIAQPPLYGITLNPKESSKNRKMEYAWTVQELREKTKDLPKGYHVQRYKGLGEMDAVVLRDTTMHLDNRVLQQVQITDYIQNNASMDIFMGSKPEKRKLWMEQNIEFTEDEDSKVYRGRTFTTDSSEESDSEIEGDI